MADSSIPFVMQTIHLLAWFTSDSAFRLKIGKFLYLQFTLMNCGDNCLR